MSEPVTNMGPLSEAIRRIASLRAMLGDVRALNAGVDNLNAEVRLLRAEVERMTEERNEARRGIVMRDHDALKRGGRRFASG